MDWQHVEDAFGEALGLPPGERPAFLERRCARHPAVRREVESLLAAHESSTGFLMPLGIAEAAPTLEERADTPGVGSVVGAYRLTREIGAGGMGTVYLGERADGAFAHAVAVKIARAAITDREAARRFHVERQTLASLRHPNVVTLIDAGTTLARHAYLVMEHVDGSPVTTWLRAVGVSLEQRLRLFRQVCSAVHAAHQQGIVHRDLKPANILVTAAGVPKVLDFGIAKLLSAELHDGATVTSPWHAPLTPDYASPEQLRGLRVTTATDVYALGVLLFEILAGVRPYETAGKPVDEVLQLVLNASSRRVSAAAQPMKASLPYPATRLRGDLDAIVQKAMHVDAARRYASAEELSDDVARFLGGKPVVAREPSLGYVLRKLAGQHRGAVTAAGIGALAVIVALGVALWQRQVALRERAAADARFNDVRQLANSLIFKVHDAVAPLTGSTAARKLIVEEALGYLDALAGGRSDESLELEVARGYVKMARALGDPNSANLGDYAGARDRLTRAIEMLEPLRTSPSVWRAAGTETVLALRTLSMAQRSLGERDAAIASARRALSVSEDLVAREPADEELRRVLASAHFNVASSLVKGEEAMLHWQRAGGQFEALLRAKPDDPERMRNVALVDKYVGQLLIDDRQAEEGLARYRRALELDERRLARQPDNRQAQLDVAIDLANLGAGLAHTGRRKEALVYYDRSVALREEIVAADPDDRMARVTLARVLANAAESYYLDGNASAARRYFRRRRELASSSPGLAQDAHFLRQSAIARVFEAYLADDAGDRVEACRLYAEGVRLAREHLPPEERSRPHRHVLEVVGPGRFASCPK